MEGHVLDLKMQMPRRSNGIYYCEASNRHGIQNISMVMNVQCTFLGMLLNEREQFLKKMLKSSSLPRERPYKNYGIR